MEKDKRNLDGPRYRCRIPNEIYDSGIRCAEDATLDSLGLKVGRSFGYWLDFGDDWWHKIDVAAIDGSAEKAKYPRLIKSSGKSPPQ